MSFLVLPPEILSGQIYSGPGPAPMLAAAQSWAGLAGELDSAAAGFSSVTSGLAGTSWLGPASAAMATVAGRYASWLGAAGAQAAGVAAQTKVAAAAYETTYEAIVHPLAVAANRSQLVSLVRSNLLGLHAPAIATTEAAYEQMWAQDVAAMAAYHSAASAAAAQLTPWQQALGSLPNLARQVASPPAAAPAAKAFAAGPGGAAPAAAVHSSSTSSASIPSLGQIENLFRDINLIRIERFIQSHANTYAVANAIQTLYNSVVSSANSDGILVFAGVRSFESSPLNIIHNPEIALILKTAGEIVATKPSILLVSSGEIVQLTGIRIEDFAKSIFDSQIATNLFMEAKDTVVETENTISNYAQGFLHEAVLTESEIESEIISILKAGVHIPAPQ